MNYKYNKDFCKAFGNQVRKLRLAKGISMRKFAMNIDMEYSQLSKIELGTINPTISTAYSIAEGLEVSTKELFEFKNPLKGKKSPQNSIQN